MGQFLVEYYDQPGAHSTDHRRYVRLFPSFSPSLHLLTKPNVTRNTHYLCANNKPKNRWPRYSAYHQLSLSPPRMRKSKPPGLFIHPNHSNIARADAVAVELSLRDERLRAPRTSNDSDDSGLGWVQDRGRETARALFGGSQRARTNLHPHSRSDSEQRLFQVGESDSESDG